MLTKMDHSRVGLSPLAEHRLRCILRRVACSEPWVDEQIKTQVDRTSGGRQILFRYFDSRAFPPRGQIKTPMRWCRFCGRYTPACCIHLVESRVTRSGEIVFSSLQCDDCRISADEDIHKELYDAGLYLRPAGSKSFVHLRYLHNDRLTEKN